MYSVLQHQSVAGALLGVSNKTQHLLLSDVKSVMEGCGISNGRHSVITQCRQGVIPLSSFTCQAVEAASRSPSDSTSIQTLGLKLSNLYSSAMTIIADADVFLLPWRFRYVSCTLNLLD